jgi:hypothetical protein
LWLCDSSQVSFCAMDDESGLIVVRLTAIIRRLDQGSPPRG